MTASVHQLPHSPTASKPKRSHGELQRLVNRAGGQHETAYDHVVDGSPVVSGSLFRKENKAVVPVLDFLAFGKPGDVDVLNDGRFGKLDHFHCPHALRQTKQCPSARGTSASPLLPLVRLRDHLGYDALNCVPGWVG